MHAHPNSQLMPQSSTPHSTAISTSHPSLRAARDPGGGSETFSHQAYVDFTASEMPLTRLAKMFDDLFPDQILIPARRLNETVTNSPTCSTRSASLILRRAPSVVTVSFSFPAGIKI
jgi:hypothetical protein